MIAKEKGREGEAEAALDHTKLELEAIESWQCVGPVLGNLYSGRSRE